MLYMNRRLSVLALQCVCVFQYIFIYVSASYHKYVVTSIPVGACMGDITCVLTFMCILVRLS